MSASVVTWSQDTSNLGPAAVAIGVFDGVHIGHQALLRATVEDARERGVRAVAVTFDRDPDQVVSAATAAPQLLTLADKLACIAETSVDVILVVPFTPVLAEMPPESFITSVLLSSMRPLSVHVGRDFRFGARAAGDVEVLEQSGRVHGFDVRPHDLVEVAGAAVTSTRIRALVAHGDIAAATDLLCRRPSVTGTVRRGRGEGVTLGFPTANVVPVPFAALPADGVYAGRALLEDGVEWAAAISVGTPPMFPEARDYLEAHLIDFEGNLYGQSIALEFWERLRGLGRYASLDYLTAAIAQDVERTLEIAGFPDDDDDDDDDAFSDDDLVDDPAALEAAEQAVARHDSDAIFEQVEGGWTALLTHVEFPEGPAAVAPAFALTSPLEAAGIPYVWEPKAPGSIMSSRGQYPGLYTLYVPDHQLEEAIAALSDAGEPYVAVPPGGSAHVGRRSMVADPEALEAAELAVRDFRERETRHAGDDLVVLVDKLPYNGRRLTAMSAALAAAGVEAVWSPYPPEEAPLLRLAVLTSNRFRIEVWNSQLEVARAVLQDLAPEE